MTDSPFKDYLGQPLHVNDYIVSSAFMGLSVSQILYFTPKMVKIKNILKPKSVPKLCYARDIVRVDEELITIFMLTRNKEGK